MQEEGRGKGPVADNVMLKLDKGGIGAMRAQREAREVGSEWTGSATSAANDLGDLFARLNKHSSGLQADPRDGLVELAADVPTDAIKKRGREESKEERKERKDAEKLAKKALKVAKRTGAADGLSNAAEEAEVVAQIRKLPIRGA